ncbi:hypothetical protein Drose_06365 [Dactylosporangium roseum]|uniref:Uncharacterized protein n=1 Tax=Dactylosporangium roseum TaxID=47989 RepID=A0ABY5Z761_9ACTN|nr:hypothetical protein [Dactylosporangium roseum]UWZ37896.1 hypothetical protein Drose_06365 [Dactylosporangium roseum]
MTAERTPSPAELWQQSSGDGAEYRRLLREHGMLIDGPAEPLPCGWTPGRRGEAPEHRVARQRTDAEQAVLADRPTVRHWAANVPVNHGTCGTCGQPVVYNLAAKVVGHTVDAVDPCEWPWPGEPMPDDVRAEIEYWRAAGEAVDRWLAQQPTTDAPALGVRPGLTEHQRSALALMRDQHERQRARRAERAGQLDLGGGRA